MSEVMLRITTNNEPAAIVLKLEGRLVGDWVEELRRCCGTAAVPGMSLRVVLTDVTFVDRAGRDLLRRLAEQGAQLVADEPMMQSVIADICSSCDNRSVDR